MAGDPHLQDRDRHPRATPTTTFEPKAATRTSGRLATATAGLGITAAKMAIT
jgi:hypothetical protein